MVCLISNYSRLHNGRTLRPRQGNFCRLIDAGVRAWSRKAPRTPDGKTSWPTITPDSLLAVPPTQQRLLENSSRHRPSRSRSKSRTIPPRHIRRSLPQPYLSNQHSHRRSYRLIRIQGGYSTIPSPEPMRATVPRFCPPVRCRPTRRSATPSSMVKAAHLPWQSDLSSAPFLLMRWLLRTYSSHRPSQISVARRPARIK